MTNSLSKFAPNIKPGLLPTPKEKMKYDSKRIFGALDPSILPYEFSVGEPLEIKNQGGTFCCVAFSLTSVSEDQEGIILEPAYTVKNISELAGSKNWVWQGTSLDIGAKAALKGFIPRANSPYSTEKDEVLTYAEPANWMPLHDEIGQTHAKQAWFWIKEKDMFNAIRSVLYMFKEEKRSVQTGVIWCQEWTNQTHIDNYGTPIGGHAIKIFGWKGDYLRIQNSYGKGIGENGTHWIHKNVVNKYLQFGALHFADMPAGLSHEQAIEKSKITIMEKMITALKQVVSLYQQLIEKLSGLGQAIQDKWRGVSFGAARSKDWPKARREYLELHPKCEACGETRKCQVHHVFPVHEFPTEELNPNNFITLCDSNKKNCHFAFGHLYNFSSYNIKVREDSAEFLEKVINRPQLKDD